jgi:hypothetical protein
VTLVIGTLILTLLVILQSSIFSRLGLAFGSPDIVMLVLIALGMQLETKRTILWFGIGGLLMSIVSSIPLMYPLIPYLIIGISIVYIRKRLWKIPLMMMAVISFVGAVTSGIIAYLTILLTRVNMPIWQSFYFVILPSSTLNIIFGIPIYLIVKDWSKWLNPRDDE